MAMKRYTGIVVFVLLMSSCKLWTEQEWAEYRGGYLNTFPLICSSFMNHSCEDWTATAKEPTYESCLKSHDERLLLCAYELSEYQKLQSLSDVPGSGGVCVFNC